MVLSSATQYVMPPEFGRKWGTACLNTRFPLPTLLCAGYSVKLTKCQNGKNLKKAEERIKVWKKLIINTFLMHKIIVL